MPPCIRLNSSSRTRSRKLKNGQEKAVKTVYDRRHKCAAAGCDKAFTRLEHLRRHQLNHDAAYTWNCNICSASFVRRDLWKRHLAVSHDTADTSQAKPCSPRSTSQSEGGFSEDVQGSSLCGQTSNEQALEESSHPATVDAVKVHVDANEYHSIFDMASSTQLWADSQSHMEQAALDMQYHTASDPLGGWGELEEANLEFFNIQCLLPFMSFDQAVFDPSIAIESLSNAGSNALDSRPFVRRKPIFLQEGQSMPFIAETGKLDPPNCGFPICNALTEEKRAYLLSELQGLFADGNVDMDDLIFSLDSMKHGIHLYFRHVNIEYTFINHEFLVASSEEMRQARLLVCGQDAEPGPLLFWAIISTGWSLVRSEKDHEYATAARIQRALRVSIMSHPGLACTPPLWLVQALFIILLFARYRGTSGEYGFASIFHGVLIEAAQRLDTHSSFALGDTPQSGGVSLETISWVQWINAESIQRLVRNAFILDVKHVILHGGSPSISPFDLDMRLYASDDAWYARSAEEWQRAVSLQQQKSVSFMDLLKMLWNPRITAVSSETVPRGSNIALYGLVSIARELCRRKEVKFLDPHKNDGTKSSLVSLGNTAIHSLRNWEPLWAKVAIPNGLRGTWLWRDCLCMIHLSYTLYEIGPVDLQTVAGKEVIEGKKRCATDYARSRRKMGNWVKEDRAWLALSRAATLIQDRLYHPDPDVVHCHHCLWCLYLATLVCWNFGFALTGIGSPGHLVQEGKVTSLEESEAECSLYLQTASSLPPRFHKEHFDSVLSRTTGLLIVLIRFFRSQCRIGMILESIDVLARLVQVENWETIE